MTCRFSLKSLFYFACLGAITAGVPVSADAAGDRPLFQAPFSCGQIWEASTYDGHWPDEDSIDLAERDGDNKVISDGQPVLASADGTVSESVVKSNGEYWVVIDHGEGWRTYNIHMEIDDKKPMTVGRKVAQGEVIGRTSNSGADNVHQHYTQRRDNDAVRIKFRGASIKTHAGNKDSWETWSKGKGARERIISLNCAGNSFSGWYDKGIRYHQIYKPGSGETKIIRMNGDGSTKTTWTGKWTRGWTHFIPYYSTDAKRPRAIVYKASTGRVSFNNIKSGGTGFSNLANGTWYKGWTHFVPFNLNGKNHILAYDSVHGYANIDRINADGKKSTSLYKKTWIPGRTQIVPAQSGNSAYLLLYQGGTGKVKITKVSASGNTVSTQETFSGNWSKGYTNIVPLKHEGSSYFLAYKSESGTAKLLKLKPGGNGVTTTATMNWTPYWTALSPYANKGKAYLHLYKTGTGESKTVRIKPGGSGIETINTKKWTWGWK